MADARVGVLARLLHPLRCQRHRAGLAVAHVDAEWAKAIPTAAGLAAIPFIVKPIDGTIDLAMEKSVTPALNGKLSGGEIPLAIGILGGCMVVPPTLFTVAAAIKDQIPA